MRKLIFYVLFFMTAVCGNGQELWYQSGSHIFNANNGSVGIGTFSPRGKFDVDGPGDIYLADDLNSGTSQSLYLPGHIYLAPYNGTNVSYIQARRYNNAGTTALALRTYNAGSLTETMYLAGNGNVGIGTNTPAYRLDVAGGIAIGGISVINTSANPNDIYVNSRVLRNESTVLADGMHLNFNSTGGAAAHLRFFANGTTERMRIDAGSGNVGIGVTTPLADARVHVKAPTSSPWGIVAEASANQKIIGISHNGTAGFISTGSAGSDGASPIHFSNVRCRADVDTRNRKCQHRNAPGVKSEQLSACRERKDRRKGSPC